MTEMCISDSSYKSTSYLGFMDIFFKIINDGNAQNIEDLTKLFMDSENQKPLNSHVEVNLNNQKIFFFQFNLLNFQKALLKDKNYDKAAAAKWLYPSLLFTFSYTFSLYDEYFQAAMKLQKERENEHLKNSKQSLNLKQIWEKVQSSMPSGPPEPFSYNQFEDLEPSNPQQEEEVNTLSEFAEETRMDFQAIWNFKKDEFLGKLLEIITKRR